MLPEIPPPSHSCWCNCLFMNLTSLGCAMNYVLKWMHLLKGVVPNFTDLQIFFFVFSVSRVQNCSLFTKPVGETVCNLYIILDTHIVVVSIVYFCILNYKIHLDFRSECSPKHKEECAGLIKIVQVSLWFCVPFRPCKLSTSLRSLGPQYTLRFCFCWASWVLSSLMGNYGLRKSLMSKHLLCPTSPSSL